MTKKSFIKTIGEKGLLSDYNTEGKKLQTELTPGNNVTITDNVISSNQVFVATYGVTKFAEIRAAYDAGKICTVFKDMRYYYIKWIDSASIMFETSDGKNTVYSLTVFSSDRWSTYTGQLQSKLTFDTTPTAGSTNPVTSDGIKTALDSRIPAPTSTTGTQVLKCIDGVVQWVADNSGSFATKEYVDSMLGNVEQQLSEL